MVEHKDALLEMVMDYNLRVGVNHTDEKYVFVERECEYLPLVETEAYAGAELVVHLSREELIEVDAKIYLKNEHGFSSRFSGLHLSTCVKCSSNGDSMIEQFDTSLRALDKEFSINNVK